MTDVKTLMMLMAEFGVTRLKTGDVELERPLPMRQKSAEEERRDEEQKRRAEAAYAERYSAGFDTWKRGGGLPVGGGR